MTTAPERTPFDPVGLLFDIRFALALSLVAHAAVIVGPSLGIFRRQPAVKEYQLVQMMDLPKGKPGKPGPRRKSREIVVPSKPSSENVSEAKPAPAPAAEEYADDDQPEGEGGGGGGGEDFGSYLPFYKVARYPQPVTRISPRYPPAAKIKGRTAEVLVQIYIDTAGLPRKVQVLRSGGKEFDDAVIEAVMKTKFRPAVGMDGKVVAGWVRVPFGFELD